MSDGDKFTSSLVLLTWLFYLLVCWQKSLDPFYRRTLKSFNPFSSTIMAYYVPFSNTIRSADMGLLKFQLEG